MLFDPRDPDQVQRVHRAGHEIMQACVALGGTISGEHGVGTEKLEGMRLVFSEDDLEFQRQLRAAFDPQGLLNPGKLLPPPAAVSRPPEPAVPESGRRSGMGSGRRRPRRARSCAAPTSAAAPVLPVGNGTQADFGNRATRAATPLRSTRLTAVTEYDPATQVVGVQAGMSLAQLQATLGRARPVAAAAPAAAAGGARWAASRR